MKMIKNSTMIIQTEEELKGVIDLYKTSNPDYEQEKEMLQSILQLNDITVQEIFTHRKNIYSIDSANETKTLLKKLIVLVLLQFHFGKKFRKYNWFLNVRTLKY